MKFINKNIKSFFVFVISSALLISNVYTVKKAESVMGYLNDLFLNRNEAEAESEITEESYTNYESTNSTKADAMIMEGWLRIRSSQFNDQSKFPLIVVGDKKFGIRTDKLGFRINESYDAKKKDADSPKSNTFFYFRLVKNLIYYSVNKKDINVIGTVEVDSIRETNLYMSGQKKQDVCFSLTDSLLKHWDFCAESNHMRKKWICKLNLGLGKIKSESECEAKGKNIGVNKNGSSSNSNNNNNEKGKSLNVENNEDTVFQPIIVIPIPSKDCNAGWDYSAKGQNWECGCSEGGQQSPINIPDKSAVVDSPVSPLFTFDVIPAKSPITTIEGELKSQEYIKIKYFKNALRILHSNLGKVVTLDGSVYIGEEIVFHTPSEHKINGKGFDMEMQIIFYGRSKGDIAKQVILSVLFQKKPGVYNKFLDDIDFFSLPNAANPERDILHDLYIPKVFLKSSDDNQVNMKPFSFYTYQGSLTMPPCSEGTIHYVVADPMPLASAPIQLFQEAIRANSESNEIPENNRETQPLNGRPVFFFDKEKYGLGDIQEPKKIAKPAGHYEKVKKQVEDYLYVSGLDPSGLPGALVIPMDSK